MRVVLTDGRDLESLVLGIEGLVLAIEQRASALEALVATLGADPVDPELDHDPEPDPTAPTYEGNQ